MTYRAKVLALAKKLSAIVEIHSVPGSETFEFTVAVPESKDKGEHQVWSACGVHELVYSHYRGPWGNEYLWKQALEDMRGGLELCGDPGCEWELGDG